MMDVLAHKKKQSQHKSICLLNAIFKRLNQE